MSQVQRVQAAVAKAGNKKRAANCARFFKTGPGQYGEGDAFAGLTVPMCRTIAKQFNDLALSGIKNLLASPIHENRLIALLILVDQFGRGDEAIRKNISDFYLKHTKRINNWDLVDLSADKILGEYLYKKPLAILDKLAISKNLWERRIAIIATFAFIKKGEYKPTLKLAKVLLNDTHDLMHKAVGWMLREVGKRASPEALLRFLDTHVHEMPRTMLRYAIERLSPSQREYYMKAK